MTGVRALSHVRSDGGPAALGLLPYQPAKLVIGASGKALLHLYLGRRTQALTRMFHEEGDMWKRQKRLKRAVREFHERFVDMFQARSGDVKFYSFSLPDSLEWAMDKGREVVGYIYLNFFLVLFFVAASRIADSPARSRWAHALLGTVGIYVVSLVCRVCL